MRFLGVDYGRRRIGLALSDASGMLARPWQTVSAAMTPQTSAEAIANIVATRTADDELSDLAGIIVGLPRRLGGDDNDQTGAAREFAQALGELTGLKMHLQDERLTSHEADARLAEREPHWRKRKALVDAVAAAIILQDFLDARARAAIGPDDHSRDPGC